MFSPREIEAAIEHTGRTIRQHCALANVSTSAFYNARAAGYFMTRAVHERLVDALPEATRSALEDGALCAPPASEVSRNVDTRTQRS